VEVTSVRINHNLSALNTYRQLANNQGVKSKVTERLSSGLRINRAGDDAAGLAVSEKMRGQIRGLHQAARNVQDAISLIQTAEGALQEVHAILGRMRELAVQAANGTYSAADRGQIQVEINQLTGEINRIAYTTTFNTMNLFTGASGSTAETAAVISGSSAESNFTIQEVARSSVTGNSAILQAENWFRGHGQIWKGNKAVPETITVSLSNNNFSFYITGPNGSSDNWFTMLPRTMHRSVLSNNIQDNLNDSFGYYGGDFTAGYDENGYFYIRNNNPDPNVHFEIVNPVSNNGLVHFTRAGQAGEFTVTPHLLPSDEITIELDGIATVVKLNNVLNSNGGIYNFTDASHVSTFLSAFNADLAAVFGAGKVTASLNGSNQLVLNAEGAGSIRVTGGASKALEFLGLQSATETGSGSNHEFGITVDGESVTVTLSEGTYTGAQLAAALETAINAATTTAADISVTYDNGNFIFRSGTEGSGSTLSIHTGALASLMGVAGASATGSDPAAVGNNGEFVFQTGDIAEQSYSLVIHDMRAMALGLSVDQAGATKTITGLDGNTVTVYYTSVAGGAVGMDGEYALDIAESGRAAAAIAAIDLATDAVSRERAMLGAAQNRLEHTLQSLSHSAENLQAAESGIRDADMARKMTELARLTIVTEVSQVMMTQANAMTQSVVQLLA